MKKTITIIFTFSIAALIALPACNRKVPDKVVTKKIENPAGQNQDQKSDLGGFEKVEEKKTDLSFKILDDNFSVKIENVETSTEAEKLIAVTRLVINDEMVTIQTIHDQEKPWFIKDQSLSKTPYSMHISSVCDQKNCDQYFLSVMLLKNDSAGDTSAYQEFAFLYEASTKSMVLGLNKKSPDDLGTPEMLESLKRSLLASKAKEKGANK